MTAKYTKEISISATTIKYLAPKQPSKEISPDQGSLGLSIGADTTVGGIGMGVLSDGTPYLHQRGLALICGVMNAHIGTISSQWNDGEEKPRIKAIKTILANMGVTYPDAHVEITHKGRTYYCYPADVCQAVLEYYAFDAGVNCQPNARENFRKLAGSKLKELIYQNVGYDPTGRHQDKFKKWHERIALNHQSAPKNYFCVFNEASTIIYELILAGAEIDENLIVDISIGIHWGKFWSERQMDQTYGARKKWPHRYPDDHPQAKSNPQEAWCYPVSALGEYRQWLQNDYLEGGKFKKYLDGKVKGGGLCPSVASLAIEAVVPAQLPSPSKKK
ncbi:hypothetical protein [Azospirillum brasilense]|uniref:hypothetical protein n=1 Tax=Azospirillum brasilense TaxID=192 RepID=UPI0010C1489F|nr:hypothetical protein [Azospirillum brasilense]